MVLCTGQFGDKNNSMKLRKTKRWGMELLLALLLAAPLLAMPGTMIGATQVEAATIRKISVVGNRRVEAETVLSYLQFVSGDRYDAGKVDDSLKSLFATGLFSDVNIRRKGNKVVVRVVENPIVNKVAFEGNSEVDDKTLASEIQLKPRSVFTRARCAL